MLNEFDNYKNLITKKSIYELVNGFLKFQFIIIKPILVYKLFLTHQHLCYLFLVRCF